jgi:hypothetical protein
MKNLSRFFVGAAALVLLTACGQSKVSYEKFHEKAVAALKEAGEKEFDVVVKGKYKNDSGEHQMDNVTLYWKSGAFLPTSALHVDEDIVAGLLNLMTADLVSEDENTTYYVGGGFKAVTKTDDASYTKTWNKYGLPTSIKNENNNYTVSYK